MLDIEVGNDDGEIPPLVDASDEEDEPPPLVDDYDEV